MKFGILGPLSMIDSDGMSRVPGALKLRTLLATFLVKPDHTAFTGQLIEELWNGCPPRTATTALQVYISNLRKILHEGDSGSSQSTILTRPGGYSFSMAGHDSDLQQFERYRHKAQRLEAVGDAKGATELLRQGLGLWRGVALADVRCTPRLTLAAHGLDELYIATCERRIELDLSLGRDANLIGELYALAMEHPSRERIHEFLMVALYNVGRPNDALQVYLSIRNSVNELFGLDPSPRLRNLQRAVLSRSVDHLSVASIAGAISIRYPA